MALRDQPFLPLYIQDIMTDEKLNECSAATHGIYIKGIMCLMHKSETYGKILIKQKHKQTDNKNKNFAVLLAKHLPYTENEIASALSELISEGVCHYEGDYLVQKRMVRDNEISLLRSKAGKTGGKNTQKNILKDTNFDKAKHGANTEYEIEYVNEDNIEDNIFEKGSGKTLDKWQLPPENKFKQELANALMLEFGFNEITHPDKLSTVWQFLTSVEKGKGLEYFQETFISYKKWKKISGDKLHQFSGLIGTRAMDFENGAWDSNNWQHLIDNFIPNGIIKKDKMSSTVEAFANTPNPFKK